MKGLCESPMHLDRMPAADAERRDMALGGRRSACGPCAVWLSPELALFRLPRREEIDRFELPFFRIS